MAEPFSCPTCGAPLDAPAGSVAAVTCPFCRTTVILPDALRHDAPQPAAESARLPGGLPAEEESLVMRLRALLASGRKIDAIKLYREKYFVGLKEAKDAVEAIEAGLLDSLPEKAASPSQPVGGPDQAAFLAELQHLIHQGNKIEAVKLYRQAYGVGLKDALDTINRIEAGQPWGENQPEAGPDQAALLAELQDLVRRGNKIEAVKRYRQVYGVGLKDALYTINRIEAGTLGALPSPQAEAARLRQEAEAAEQAKRASGCLREAIPFSVDRGLAGGQSQTAGPRGCLRAILSVLLIASLVFAIGLLAVRCSGPTPEMAAPWLSVVR